jgi:ribonucleoside-diphosphate reductase alpha chain
MTTSIIDYIFRELAITYLGRHDLAHVNPEDLRGDAMHDQRDHDPEPEGDEGSADGPAQPVAVAAPFAAPRSSHLHPLPKNGHGTNGHKLTVNRLAASESKDDQIKLARLKGYEGDPCSECGQLTLVRSGACCKCDTCGASSGCS